MNRFTEIRIDGFRRLCGIELPLKPLNVVIGANGVGKTSLLEVFDLLKASAEGKLATTISDRGGIDVLLTKTLRGDTTSRDEIQIGLSGIIGEGEHLDYRLNFQSLSMLAQFRISKETLSTPSETDPFYYLNCSDRRIAWFDHREKRLIEVDRPVGNSETALSQVERPLIELFNSTEQFRLLLASSILCSPIDGRMRSPVRLPQSLSPAEWPGLSGENLISCLYTMKEAHEDRYATVLDTLRTAFPTFSEIGFPPVAAGTLTLTWKDSRFSEPVFLNQLSEGTLRFLWLATLLASPGLPAVTLIDEPEISLHPELLSLLAELLRDASTRTQLIVATQSDSLIRFLKPEEVVVMDMGEDGLATATRADTFDLDAWLKDYTLDEVWRMGQLGGKAW